MTGSAAMTPATQPPGTLRLRVREALSSDAGRGLARLAAADLAALGVAPGAVVEIRAKHSTVAVAAAAEGEGPEPGHLRLDGISRDNAGTALEEVVTVAAIAAAAAERVELAPRSPRSQAQDLSYLTGLLDGLPVVVGDRLRANLFGNRWLDFTVTATLPAGAVRIGPATRLVVSEADGREAGRAVSYADVGGLRPQLQRIREIVELPLRHPEVFARLGIDAPNGVLLYGPPGCGKTLIARAIAHQTEAAFFTISGPEIIHKFYGESEAQLREVFDQAAGQAPSIVFLDEIDAIAPARERVPGEVEKRVVAQLLVLLDSLATRRSQVIVLAATNRPNALDPALRRPGRFDREVYVPIPDRGGRRQILAVHSRHMPLAGDVDLDRLAALTHGFVGADLQALCREAAMARLRHLLPDLDLDRTHVPDAQLQGLEVGMADFLTALREIEPSALRELVVETPAVGWADVAGLAVVKQHLVEACQWPLLYPELFLKAGLRPPRGLLLSGPPGCGKTLVARALAAESELNFIAVRSTELLSRFVGESEKALRDVFRTARQVAPCIVFFDELDALVPARGSESFDSGVSERLLAQFLVELDGIEELRGVLVLAATNRPDVLDPAVRRPGRFDLEVEVPLPDEADRAAILAVHLRHKPLAPGIDLAPLAAATAGLSGADLAEICRRAALAAVRRAVPSASPQTVQLEPEDLESAGEEVRRRRAG